MSRTGVCRADDSGTITVAQSRIRIARVMGNDDMFLVGPSIDVQMRKIGAPHTYSALALIDTGAGHSALGPELAAKLDIESHESAFDLQRPNEEAAAVPIVRALMKLPEGPEVEMDFAVLTHLGPPHDLLLGRDFLQVCRLSVDFIVGKFELHIERRLVTTTP